MLNFFSKIRKRHLAILLIILLFIPFPTQMIPEWRIQVVDENNRPLVNVRVQQIYNNYTFWGCCSSRYDDKISDEDGYAVFPRKYLWASSLSRIVYPPLASLMRLAHGSAGTYSYVRTIDDNYTTEFTPSWTDGERIYSYFPAKFSDKLVTKRIKKEGNK
jgi:hypothetical protein